MSKPKSIESAMERERRKELRTITKARKVHAAAAHRELRALKKQADKIVRTHQQRDERLARRAAILESRLAS